jgi:hypothetical protein
VNVDAGVHHAWCLFGTLHARGLTANTFALGSALRSTAAAHCSAVGAQLHSLGIKSGLANNVFAASALLDVYAKCGCLSDARRVGVGVFKTSNKTIMSAIFGISWGLEAKVEEGN